MGFGSSKCGSPPGRANLSYADLLRWQAMKAPWTGHLTEISTDGKMGEYSFCAHVSASERGSEGCGCLEEGCLGLPGVFPDVF